jgi:hypothetical protein
MGSARGASRRTDDGEPTAARVVPEVEMWRAVLALALKDARSQHYATAARAWCESRDFDLVADCAGVGGGIARDRLRRAILARRRLPHTARRSRA